MPTFNYERASIALAEGVLFGKKSTCEKFNIPNRTYDDWHVRLKTDEKLIKLYHEAVKELKQQWQEESIQTLRMALYIFRQGLENHPFSRQPKDVAEMEVWSKSMDSMAKAIKSIGDLAISGSFLNDDDD